MSMWYYGERKRGSLRPCFSIDFNEWLMVLRTVAHAALSFPLSLFCFLCYELFCLCIYLVLLLLCIINCYQAVYWHVETTCIRRSIEYSSYVVLRYSDMIRVSSDSGHWTYMYMYILIYAIEIRIRRISTLGHVQWSLPFFNRKIVGQGTKQRESPGQSIVSWSPRCLAPPDQWCSADVSTGDTGGQLDEGNI